MLFKESIGLYATTSVGSGMIWKCSWSYLWTLSLTMRVVMKVIKRGSAYIYFEVDYKERMQRSNYTQSDDDDTAAVDYRNILGKFIKAHPGMYAMYMVVLLVFPAEALVFPHVFSHAMTKVQSSKSPSMRDLTKVAVLWAGVQCLFLLMHAIDLKMVPMFNAFARNEVVGDIVDGYKEHFHDANTGSLLSGIIKLPEAARELFYQIHQAAFADTVLFVCTAIYFFWLHRTLGWIFLVALIVWFIITYYFYKTCSVRTYNKETEHNNLHEQIEEVVSNLMAVFVYGTSTEEATRIKKKGDTYTNYLQESLSCAFKFRILYTILVIAVFMIIMYVSVQLVVKKEIDQATFVAIFIVTFTTMGNMMTVFQAFKNIQHSLGVVASSGEAINKASRPPANLERVGRGVEVVPGPSPVGDIVFKDVTYKTAEGKVILQNINVTFKEGNRTAIVGSIGSGKSSGIRLIMRLDRPSAGDISVGGRSIYSVDLRAWRKNVAFVPQTPRLMDRTLRENLMYGGAIKDVEKAIGVLHSIGMEETAATFLKRLDEPVGKGGNKLSGGQRQMVWLLRAMMSDAPVVVMDEPTSALDYTSRDQVVRFISTALKEKTLIMITHDQALLSQVDSVYETKDGGMTEKSSKKTDSSTSSWSLLA
jgi:ABC-type multidrug transport system fused ATPase/permease subunit